MIGWFDGTGALQIIEEGVEEIAKVGPRLVPPVVASGLGATGGATLTTGGVVVLGSAAILTTTAVAAKAVWEEYRAREAVKKLREVEKINAHRGILGSDLKNKIFDVRESRR